MARTPRLTSSNFFQFPHRYPPAFSFICPPVNVVKWPCSMQGGREKNFRFNPNTDSVEREEVIEKKRNYRSDITGISVRLKSELVFETERNLHCIQIVYFQGKTKVKKNWISAPRGYPEAGNDAKKDLFTLAHARSSREFTGHAKYNDQ